MGASAVVGCGSNSSSSPDGGKDGKQDGPATVETGGMDAQTQTDTGTGPVDAPKMDASAAPDTGATVDAGVDHVTPADGGQPADGGEDGAAPSDDGAVADAGDGSIGDGAVNRDLTGMWFLVCCSSTYNGEVTFVQTGTTLSGMFDTTNNQTGGTIAGTVNGDDVMFTRTWDTGSQVYVLTLSPDGNTLTGTLSGTHDTTVDNNVTMTRM